MGNLDVYLYLAVMGRSFLYCKKKQVNSPKKPIKTEGLKKTQSHIE